MEIQLDKTTLPANEQQVRFRTVGSSDWLAGYFLEEDENFISDGTPYNAFEVEEWEPEGGELTPPERLRKHRESLGYTQGQYANILGLSRDATISDWENGKKPVPGFVEYVMKLEKEVHSFRKRYPVHKM